MQNNSNNICLDINTQNDVNLNWPCYGASNYSLADKIIQPNGILRIKGQCVDRDQEDLTDGKSFHDRNIGYIDHKQIDFNSADNADRLVDLDLLSDAGKEILSVARHFAIPFPKSFLKSDGVTFSDIVQTYNEPDALANNTRKLLQILLHLFCKEGIHLIWGGLLDGDPNPEYLESLKNNNNENDDIP
ncbi:MAG: hypothetical protein AABY22_30775, partial [Nanoarchaeota archaeon]